MALRTEDAIVDFAERLRRLPERWVLAVSARRPSALLLSFLVVGSACWGLSAISDMNTANRMAGIFMFFVVLSGVGQWRFRRQLQALDRERSDVAAGSLPNASAPDPSRPRRNPRSAAFLNQGGPSGHFAAAIAAFLPWALLILLSSHRSHVDWFGELGCAPEILGGAVAAALAFEGVGYHQAISRRADDVARLRRELARAASPHTRTLA